MRGFGETRFLDAGAPRSGEMAVLSQRALDFADAIGFGRFAILGHDWGARVAAVLGSTHAERLSHCATLSVA
jgi:pimeloyl-ACP methyl ester carboxylesterase